MAKIVQKNKIILHFKGVPGVPGVPGTPGGLGETCCLSPLTQGGQQFLRVVLCPKLLVSKLVEFLKLCEKSNINSFHSYMNHYGPTVMTGTWW